MVSLMMYWSLIYTLCQTLLHAFSVCMVHPNYATNTNTAHRNRIKILAKSFTEEAFWSKLGVIMVGPERLAQDGERLRGR